ncbi:protein of unknown function DUF485 [Thermocrinis albus DSM 14484]|uniref:DUF485 domain-containing protein n=1 Tax=Thermocrinis albus (strain DSM 14484 / JCM 11386 / HI 11/12) TaxID=638303 RepID=D3SQH7_THEAH|nr:DUF485 domain-containing protein [Thermocrinis albus]ADC89414.1 protein of unknown function DUF485 [Thermocrinis albus DSM 14484]
MKHADAVLRDQEFLSLRRKVSITVALFTIIMLVVYYSFILLIAYGKAFLSQPIREGASTTVGIVLGIGVIVFSWLLTGAYVFWANREYDTAVKKLRNKVGG